MMRGIIRVHCIAQEYWYIHRQHCECGGQYERVIQALTRGPSGYVDRLTVRCKQCGGTSEYDFDISTCGGPDYTMKFMDRMIEWSDVIGHAEATRAFGPPMEAALGLISELADNGDELALDYLADAIVHARRKLKDQAADETPGHLSGGDPRVSQPFGIDASVSAGLVWAIDAVIQQDYGHTERVCQIARLIGVEMELNQDELQTLETAAMLHDIGKLAVPDYILSKPDQLSQEEMKKVRTHTLVGAAILEPVQFPWPVIPVIRSHHEWWDGAGYPDGLAGDQIPLAARILTVADIYDALLSHRPYRPAMTVQDAVAFMRERAGTQFDPSVLDTCFRVLASQQAHNQFGFIFDANAFNQPTQDSPVRRAIFMDIKQAHQELLALYDFVQSMGQSLDVQETLDLIMNKTKRIVDFATCVIFLREDDGDDLVAMAVSGPFSDAILHRRLPLGSGCSGRVAERCRPSGLGRSAGDDLMLLLGQSAHGCALTEVLSAPLGSDRESIGALTLYRASDRPFSEDDARLLSVVSRQATVAISAARRCDQTQ